MSDQQSLVCAAGNVVVPSYLALKSKGYVVASRCLGQDDETWSAEKEGLRFLADTILELLGLVTMYEIRGMNWRATDEEIDAFLQKSEPTTRCAES